MIKLNKLVGIYKITNTKNNQVYIGESNDIDRRWDEHIDKLNNNSHHSYKLQEAWNEYGKECFTFDILEIVEKLDSPYKTTMQLIYEEGKYIDQYNSINNGYNVENTIDKILSGEKVIMSRKTDHSYLTKLINKNCNTDIREDFIMIPNNAVQNIIIEGKEKPSYIQLYGKRTITYIINLLKLQNINNDIHFSIDMILWMKKLEGRVEREKKLFKDFLVTIHKNNLIELNNDIDLDLGSSNFIIGKLNIHEYNQNGEFINCFKLTYSEYNAIMSYNGKLDNYNLLNLYCNLKSRIRKNSENTPFSERELEICYPSYETIKSDIFIESDKTLKQYIDALVTMNLIRFGCAGDMIYSIKGSQPIRRKANFIYVLYHPHWEEDLKSSVSLFKSKQISLGWKFLTESKEVSANERRSITQKINMLDKLSKEKLLTQSQRKELMILKRQKEKWNLTIEEQKALQEIEDLNRSQIPLDVLQMIENELNERKEDEE